MTSFQPARWKNVVCGHSSTNLSQASTVAWSRLATASGGDDPRSGGTPIGNGWITVLVGLRLEKYFCHAVPVEIGEQPIESAFHPTQIDVVPESSSQVRSLPRLFRIDFPGMKEEH